MKLLLLIPLLFLLSACSGAEAERTPAPLDRSRPVEMSGDFVTVATDNGVTLQYHPETAYIRVLDAQGNMWESTPHDLEDDPLVRGMVRMAFSSMITVSFLSGAGNMSHETAAAASVRQGGLSAYYIPNGVRVEFYFPAQRTMVPVEITLENGTMLAAIRPEHIERVRPAADADEDEWEIYNRNHRLMEVGLLPHFMHAGVAHEGYILVPDGSGALINLNNGRPRTPYNQPVYGRDSVSTPRQNAGGIQHILLPVFGMKRDNAAIFAIIEGGAALASISAGTSGGNSSYNSASASFSVRPPGSYTVTNAQGVPQEILVTTEELVGVEALAVRYYFLPNGSGYSEMANVYRQHLISQGMTPSGHDAGLPLVLDIFGSVTRRMSVLGIPRNVNTALTTFEQAQEMAETLLDGGIEHLIIRYNNWLPRGNYSTAPSRFSPSGRLGGRSGFNDFADAMRNMGVALYMDANFTTSHRRPFLGIIGTPIIRDIANLPVRQNSFDLSTFMPAEEPYPGWWLFAPTTFTDAVDTFASRANNRNITGLSLATLSNSPYSDISRGNRTDRGTTEMILADIARTTRESFDGLMGSAAGAYWLPHASVVLNTPIGNSGFTITDASVPFYQMVLHGYVDFSLPAFNLAADREGMILRAAETGALLQLSVIAENPSLLVDTPLEWLMSPSFDFWYEEALRAVRRLAPVYNAVAGSTVVRHSFPMEGVTLTEFSNGTAVYVNYNRHDAEMPLVSIPARDFVIIPGIMAIPRRGA